MLTRLFQQLVHLLLCHLQDASDILHTGFAKKVKLCLPDISSQIQPVASFLRITLTEIGVSTYLPCSTEKGWSFEGRLSSPS